MPRNPAASAGFRPIPAPPNKDVAPPCIPVHHDPMTIDPNGKYWSICRETEYYACWREHGLEADINYFSRMWSVNEFYVVDKDKPPTAQHNYAESYEWARTYSLKKAQEIAEYFAAKHGGTVFIADGVSKGVADPNTYNPDDWK